MMAEQSTLVVKCWCKEDEVRGSVFVLNKM